MRTNPNGDGRSWPLVVALVVLGAVALAVGANVLAGEDSESGPVTSSPLPAFTLPAATADHLHSMATDAGAAPEAPVQLVTSTRGEVARVLGTGELAPDLAAAEVLVAMVEGDLTLETASRPPGASAPTGRYLVVTYATTDPGLVQDVQLTSIRPDLARLGFVTATRLDLLSSLTPGS